MFRNYLISALRNLARNRLYAAINIIGLAAGFAAALLLALFVRHELTYDRWIPDHQQIYQVLSTYAWAHNGEPREGTGSWRNVAKSLSADYPEVEVAARMSGRATTVSRGSVRDIEHEVVWVDPEFFAVFSFPVVAGDLRRALEHPDGIVLTRRLVRKYFHSDDPIGQTVLLDGEYPMQVRAVIEDLPSNSMFGEMQGFMSGRAAFSRLTTLDARTIRDDDLPFGFMVETFLRLKPGASIDRLQNTTAEFIAKHIPRRITGSFDIRYRLITSSHLDPPTAPPHIFATIYAAGAIGLLLVLVAAINFVNLTTARASRRAVEVGVRKASGAQRPDLMAQFVGESVVYTTLGMGLAIALVYATLPSMERFLVRSMPFGGLHDPTLLVGIATVVLVVGVLAGIYPGLVLSAFRPATVLKGQPADAGGNGIIRGALSLLQFAVFIALIVATTVVYRQIRFGMNESLRFNKDQVLNIEDACRPSFKAAVEALPGVRITACSWNTIDALSSGWPTPVSLNGKAANTLQAEPIDFGFLEVYGLQPRAGRFFRRDVSTDEASSDSATNPNVVINDAAVRALGFTSRQAAVGQSINWQRMLAERRIAIAAPPSQIIGVVDDFALDGTQTKVLPTLYYADRRMSLPGGGEGFVDAQMLNVKLEGRRIPETLRALDRLWTTLGGPLPIRRSFIDQRLEVLYLDLTRQAQLFACFSGVALVIGILGLFGLSAFIAERRTKEIGIRKAMGASKKDILRLLLWQFAKPVLWANILAWPAAYLLTRRWLEGFVHHVDLQPWMFFAASGIALAIAVVTVIGHTLLVVRAKPVTALRYE